MLADEEEHYGEDDEELPCVGPLNPMVDLLPVSELSVLPLVTAPEGGPSHVVQDDEVADVVNVEGTQPAGSNRYERHTGAHHVEETD